jgi:glutamate synthase (NADPH/NADH) small chain
MNNYQEPIAFLETPRARSKTEEPQSRTTHFREYEGAMDDGTTRVQGSRCMQCAVPFCHSSCPTSNLIPEFSEAASKGDLAEAWNIVTATNPFPEITGRVCPAPCETSCCLGSIREPVSIKAIERKIGDWGLQHGNLQPIIPPIERRGRVTIIGSGPCGMAAAARLRQEGFKVRIIEKAAHAGGLLRYGIPDYKLAKSIVDQRTAWLQSSSIQILTGVAVGEQLTAEDVLAQSDAVGLAVGFEHERPLRTTGSDKEGVFMAMDYLTAQNEATQAGGTSRLNVAGQRVIVIGGGDTGWDCVGTALRQGAQSVLRVTSRRRLPQVRPGDNPWPEPPQVQRRDTQTEECQTELYDIRVVEIMGGRSVEAVRCERILNRADRVWNKDRDSIIIEADRVIVAQGFQSSGSEKLYDLLGLAHSEGTLVTENGRTNRPMIFAGGDAVVGPSLVVTAIRSGLEMADSIAHYLREG